VEADAMDETEEAIREEMEILTREKERLFGRYWSPFKWVDG